jgi:O-antigen/teichoic acid export membrane protein
MGWNMSQEKFMTSSIYLFLDLIVIAASGWLYWLIISKLIPISVVGQSTSVYSLVVLTSSIVGLGLEYPLLKKTSNDGSKIIGSSILIEILVAIIALPFMIAVLNNIHYQDMQVITVIAILMFISIALGFVARYALLGISASRTILLIDTISTVAKFVTGFILVLSGFGVLGVLLSFMLQSVISVCIALALINKSVGVTLGDLKYIKNTIVDGVVNIPSIFSRTLIFSLSVVLLASFGVTSSEIGVFYITLMISVVAGGLISSTAYMVIPASSMAQKDLVSGSIRIGISLTAPIITVLLVSPKFVLSLIGAEYASGQVLLMILAVGILPFAFATNTISRFNYLGMTKRILFIGLIQIIGFIVSFVLLVPQIEVVGAALSILISYSISCIPVLIWSEKILLRYLANTAIAVMVGWAISFTLKIFLHDGITNEITTFVTAIIVTMAIIVALKNTSVAEIRTLLRSVVNPGTR